MVLLLASLLCLSSLLGKYEALLTTKPSSLPQTSIFLHGRAVCQHYTAENNHTRPDIVVCPKGIKQCFTSAYIVRKGKSVSLKIHKQGCWKSQAKNLKCSLGSCLIVRPPNESEITSAQTCCCRGFTCNKNVSYIDTVRQAITYPFELSTSPKTTVNRQELRIKEISPKDTIILGVISSVFATFLILSIVFVSWGCAARKNRASLPRKTEQHKASIAVEETVYSTISNDDIVFGDLISSGSFSTVWKCEYEGRKVAIKMFSLEYDKYWRNECLIHDVLGVHPNIAVVLAGVEVVSPMSTKKAIIMTHYNHGSLLEYLASHILRWDEMYKLMLSLANGVAFIHGEIDEYDNWKRTVVVHQNLNSCNVLIKEDATCALSGFGVATHIKDKNAPEIMQPDSILYTPPEVLNDAVNWHDWDSSLKQVDVYALGLIFWEIVSRCECFYAENEIPNATQPYVAKLGEKPGVEVLKDYISQQKKRPVFPKDGDKLDENFSLLTNTIEECWDMEAEARLTALCVVKRMQQIHAVRYDNRPKNEAALNAGDESSGFDFSSYTIPLPDDPEVKLSTTEGVSLLDLRSNKCEITLSDGTRQVCYHASDDRNQSVFQTLLHGTEPGDCCVNV